MKAKYTPAGRVGIPIDCADHGCYCTISLDAFDALSRARITTQRSLLSVGAKLGAPLHCKGGFQEFELLRTAPLRGSTAGSNHEQSTASEASHDVPEGDSHPDSPATEANCTTADAVQPSGETEKLAPLVMFAPTTPINRTLVEARLRSCPDELLIDGKIVPWGSTASPRPMVDPPEPAPPVALARVGDETLLRGRKTRYRSADAEQARSIAVGTDVIVHGGEELRPYIARPDAIRLQREMFTAEDPPPEAPP